MSKVLVTDTHLTDIANAIRNKNGSSDTYKPSEMASAISSITTGDTTIEDGLLNKTLSGDYVNDRVTTIGYGSLSGQKSLTSISLPNLIRVEERALFNCAGATTINMPNVEYIGNYGVASCGTLTEVYLPKVITLGTSAFYQDRKVTSVYAPLVETISTHAFRYCPLQEEVRFPCLTSIGDYAFQGCTNVKILDLNVIPKIGAYSLKDCTSLETLILRKTDDICTLANTTNALTGTPIANGTGYVYVPDDLVDSYKAYTNWSVYADQIKPLTELEG